MVSKPAQSDLSRWHAEQLSIDEKSAQSIETSIRITAGGLFFFGRHTGDLSECRAAYFPFEGDMEQGLKELFYTHSALSLPFRATHIYIDEGEGYVVVPKDLQAAGSAHDWLAACMPLQKRVPQLIEIDDMAAQIAFSTDRALYEFCQRSFSLPHFDHLARPLASATLRYSRRTYPRVLAVRLGSSSLDVVCAVEGQLLLCNRYAISRDAVDALYFVTALWRQLGLSQQEDHLLLYGQHLEPLEQLLHDRITHLYSNLYPGLLVDTKELNKMGLHLPPEIILDTLCV